MARGHKISQLPEIPLVVANEALEGVAKTKKALSVFKKLRVEDDVNKVKTAVVHRAGKGKMRNRPYKEKVGPLVVYSTGHGGNVAPAVRNLPGVEVADVARLSLLRLAPGGHLGRLIIWTRSAFEQLDKLWGTINQPSKLKSGFTLPRPILANPDVTRVIRSDSIRSVLRPVRIQFKRKRWLNPFTHHNRMVKLNPYVAVYASRQKNIDASAAKRAEAKNKLDDKAKAALKAKLRTKAKLEQKGLKAYKKIKLAP